MNNYFLRVSNKNNYTRICTCAEFFAFLDLIQGLYRLEKYLNLEGFFEKSLKIKSAFKSTGKSLKSLEKSLNSTIFCST